MKLETYLNAMVKASHSTEERRDAQIRAFRDRILRMFEEKDDVIKHLLTALNEADEEIEKLEDWINEHDSPS